ncbi:hypothetical protein PUNSTDRAFT_123366 [Punctularia strigosozonata HHB-11173 SS5]|uniref:uncharacterized protein n=1 Tax=Punctularia strigosozonata (strain HHB-11173) TaxID=741275 RepID=UPI0004416F7E|nr:uncharacterized protein PUNSTDRAFT_123366 [Punctularia strigosozonata HHB-11173 SS5]EIN13228.1 hypothetical protein PUNSTDRAFT_123366 [Punctularia strigosozonata HHB-11173 SS5]
MSDPGPSRRFYRRAPSEQFDREESSSLGMVTPDSSPIRARLNSRRMAATPPLIRETSVSSDRTPGGIKTPRLEGSHVRIKLEEPVTPLNSTHMMSPPLSAPSQHSRSHSQLSSPFMGKQLLFEPGLQVTPRVASSSPASGRLAHVDDIFSTPIAQQSSTSMAAIPATPAHTFQYAQPEMARVYMQKMEEAAAEQAARRELHRPDYLRRMSRNDGAEGQAGVDHRHPRYELDPALLANANAGPSTFPSVPGLGVTESPVKGRRITLFQETSEESFEESLLAGGYGKYRTIPPEPQFHIPISQDQPDRSTPGTPAQAGAYQGPLHWLHTASPGPSPQTSTPVPGPSALPQGPPTDEAPSSPRDAQKRRRLEAFRGSSRASGHSLHPVNVEGMGRILMNVTNDDAPASTAAEESPGKKRSGRRKKPTKGAASNAPTPKHPSPVRSSEGEVEGPNWLDSEFPWCLRNQERAEAMRAEEEHKLMWISRFLDRESDSDEDEEHEILPSATWGEIYEPGEPPMPVRMGRGKMVPFRADSAGKGSVQHKASTVQRPRRGMFFPSDPSDARAALLSKRRAREIIYKKQKLEKGYNDDDGSGSESEVVCICRGRDDGRGMVNCDGCRTWYHLECLGIDDPEQLGGEDDAWYCAQCQEDRKPARGPVGGRSPSPRGASPAEPMLVPTDETPMRPKFLDPLFAPTYFQASPSAAWSAQVPSTPVRGEGHRSSEPSTRTSFGSSSSRLTAAPSTPQTSHTLRAGSTPAFPDVYSREDFDPFSTPSRGMKLSSGPFTTPRPSWSVRASANGLFQTPSRPLEPSSSMRFPSPPFGAHHDYRDSSVRQSEDRTKLAMHRTLPARALWDPESPSPAARRVDRPEIVIHDP